MKQEEIKEQIIYFLKITERPGIENLIKYMEENEFFTAPCSSQYHLCYPGGLAEHSLNVCRIMDSMSHAVGSHIKLGNDGISFSKSYVSTESIFIVSLLHDIGKAVYHNKPLYTPNILKDGKQSEKKPYERNTQLLGIPHEVAALEIISKFIELTEDEAHAILFHNGLYTAVGREVNGKETPLQMLLHFADLWASRVVEVAENDK